MVEIVPFPFFFAPTIFPDGWTVGVVFSFCKEVIPVGEDPVEFIVARYRTLPGFLSPDEPVSTELTFTDELGMPAVHNTVVVGADAYDPEFDHGTVVFEAFVNALFRRGDCNHDLALDLADGVFLLSYLFTGGMEPVCLSSCDPDANATLGIPDALYIFSYLALGGPPPLPPFPLCGGDDSGLPCESYDVCP